MYHGYEESAEKILERMKRILADYQPEEAALTGNHDESEQGEA